MTVESGLFIKLIETKSTPKFSHFLISFWKVEFNYHFHKTNSKRS